MERTSAATNHDPPPTVSADVTMSNADARLAEETKEGSEEFTIINTSGASSARQPLAVVPGRAERMRQQQLERCQALIKEHELTYTAEALLAVKKTIGVLDSRVPAQISELPAADLNAAKTYCDTLWESTRTHSYKHTASRAAAELSRRSSTQTTLFNSQGPVRQALDALRHENECLLDMLLPADQLAKVPRTTNGAAILDRASLANRLTLQAIEKVNARLEGRKITMSSTSGGTVSKAMAVMKTADNNWLKGSRLTALPGSADAYYHRP